MEQSQWLAAQRDGGEYPQGPVHPVIITALFDAEYIEQREMGLDTMVHLLQEESLPFPQMKDKDTRANFLIQIEGHRVLDKHVHLGLIPC